MEIEVPRIEDETTAWGREPFLLRYFDRFFCRESDGGIYHVLVHSNKMILLTLATSHPILKKGLKVESVNFQVTDKLNRLDNKVSGKRKHGGQALSETSTVCEINCTSPCNTPWQFTVKSHMVGKLLEVNEALVKEPELIKNPTRGYIAILGPRLRDLDAKIGTLLVDDPTPFLLLPSSHSRQ